MFKQFSPNMLKTYENCPKKFYLRYVKNISMPVNDEIFELGKNIHALASYYLRRNNIDKMEASLSSREKEIWEYLKGIKYFSYDVVETEYNLSVKIGENFFGGRIDALVKNEDTYYILDYKTGAIPKNAKYDFQTIIYMLAVKEFFKSENVVFVYLDLKNRDEFKIVFDKDLEIEYIKKLKDSVSNINSETIPSKKQECKCEYSLICY